MTVLALPNSLAYARLGTTVSIRNAGGAVPRNRIKRLIRESFRQHQEMLAGFDYVVMVRSGVSTLSNSVIFETLDKHWNRLAEKCGKS